MQPGMNDALIHAALARARDYPSPLPHHSYHWRGGALQSVHAYISRRGHVMVDGDAVALAVVPARGRKRPARTTAQDRR